MRIRLAPAPLLLLLTGLAVSAFSLTFTHLAGSFGGPGFEDGSGNAARFKSGAGVAVDGSGNLYVADTANHTIRKVTPAGVVTTLAGFAETPGATNGHGGYARFNGPEGLAVDGSGNVYVADTANHAIRRITPAGVVSTFAGLPGAFGFVNATGTSARFYLPRSITIDGSGDLYVADSGNHSIRRITSAGVVSTFAGTGSAGNANGTGTGASFASPNGIVYSATVAALYVSDTGNRVVRQITVPGAVVTTFAGTMGISGTVNGTPGQIASPRGIAVAADGTLYVADDVAHVVRTIATGGSLGSVAGLAYYPGPEDGVNTAARFFRPNGVAVSGSTLYVADAGNHTVRSIALAPGSNSVSTFAGLANAAGYVNATGSAARFNNPGGISFYPGPTGFSYVADTGNNAIRRVGMDGVVTTIAGGTYGYADGNGTSASFRNPKGLTFSGYDYVTYVADTGNNCIRKIDHLGEVTRFAGQCGSTAGSANGDRLTTATFNQPQAVARKSDALYVADTGNRLIRRIDFSTGAVTTFAGSGAYGSANGNGTAASFGVVTGLSTDGTDLFAAESMTYTIRKITPSADVTTLAGSCCGPPVDGVGTAARFGYPGPTSVSGTLDSGYVADKNAHLIRSLVFSSATVGTAGGRTNVSGTSDGTGPFARFNFPNQLSTTGGAMMITEGHTIRYGGPELADRAVIDSATGLVGQARQLDTSPQTATSWEWSVIRRPAGSTASLSAINVRNPTFTPDVADLYVFRCKAVSTTGVSISTVALQANGATTSLSIGYPGPETAGVPFQITVTARDIYGSVGDGYTGTIRFTSGDPTATLPADYTFTAADHGVKSFSVTLRRAGTISITATDVANASITGSTNAHVIAAAPASIGLALPATLGSGSPATATVTAYDEFGNVATSYRGTVHFTSTDGTASLPPDYTFTAGDIGRHEFTNGVTLYASGAQQVTAKDNASGFISTQNVVVGLPTPTNFAAAATSTTQVQMSWTASAGAATYEIMRRSAASSLWAPLATTSSTGYIDNTVSAGAGYFYRVRATAPGSAASPFTAPDGATTILFTDDPLAAGTRIKGVHLTQLRTAVNALRTAAGLSAMTFTDPSITTSTVVKGVHVTELRTGLNAARVAMELPALTFTDAVLGPTVRVKAVHITEVRSGVK